MVTGNLPDEDLTVRITSIFMQEMDVDIAPYQSFEVLRLRFSLRLIHSLPTVQVMDLISQLQHTHFIKEVTT